jgi:rhodanese-related sulfurtransferase
MKKTLGHVAVILALGGVLGLGANRSLVRRFLRGEFRETFLTTGRYPGIRMITLLEAEDLFAGRQALFLDARAAGLFGDGHVPEARNLPYEEARSGIPEEILALERKGTIVVYCEGGDCQSSLALAKLLHAEGFEDLRIIEGGWEEWRIAGLPEIRDDD